MKDTKNNVKHIDFIDDWKETTCIKAQKLQEQGFTIWWRPKGIVSKDPDNDLALYR